MKAAKIFITAIALLTTSLPLQAQTNSPHSPGKLPAKPAVAIPAKGSLTLPTAPAINAKGYILVDANSGQILASKNADVRMKPASLTKIVSMYVISQALQAGKIHLTDLVPISKKAWSTGGSRMFVQAGTQVPVQDLIDGIVIASGNDATVAMAEYIGGSQDNFVNMMNQTAARLGMKNSHFSDVNGLPIHNHYTTPRDLAILVRDLVENFPQDYKWYGQKWFVYNNIKQPNRNRLLWQDSSVDGLKTGFTNGAGYCLIASANRNGMRLISVVMGAPTPAMRAKDSLTLLNWGFHNFSTHQLFAADHPLVAPRVWFGANKEVPLGLAQGLFVTIPTGQYQDLKALLTLDKTNLNAPIAKGQAFGKVNVMLGNQPLISEPIIALQSNPRGNFFERMRDHIFLHFQKSA